MQVSNKQVNGKWIGEVRNDSFAPGQAAIIYLPGIDRKDPTQSLQGLLNIENANLIGGADPVSLFRSTDHFKTNLVTTAPKHEYENGEITDLLAYSKSNFSPGAIYGLLQSLGGFGFMREVSKNADLAKQYDALVWMASGPGTSSNTAKNLADAKVPNWFLTAEDDIHSGTTASVSIDMHNSILAAGGISFLTVFAAGSFPKDPHVIFGELINKWDSPPAKAFSNNVVGTIVPKMGIFQWMLSNRKGQPVVAPDGVYKPYVAPAPEPLPRKAVITLYSDNTWESIS